MNTAGKMIRKSRLAKGQTLREVEEGSGVNRTLISMMERGDAAVTVKSAIALMGALELPDGFVSRVLMDALSKADPHNRWVVRAHKKKSYLCDP